MKLTKGQGISFFAAILAFVVLSVALFLLPVEHNLVFWLAYLFVVYAMGVMLVSVLHFFNRQVNEEQFMNLPVVMASWLYLIAQFYLSYREVTTLFLPYTLALVANLVLALVFTVLILVVSASMGHIEKSNEKITQKVLFIGTLKNQLSSIECSDGELRKRIDRIIEDVTYSDPMSHSALEETENRIMQKVRSLSENCTDTDKAMRLCDEISKLLKTRNEQCLTYKTIKDTAAAKTDTGNGNRIAVAGVGVAFGIVLAVLAIVFYIVPQSEYKNACALMESGDYEEAIASFENLNGFKDSVSKIEKIKETICEEKYEQAETALSDGDYDKAFELFFEIASYKDAKEKLVEIKNRTSSDAVIYFGTYQNEPVAWRIIESDNDKRLLLLADQSIKEMPISDDMSETTFEKSSLAKWLNGEFLSGFSSADIGRIIEIDGMKVSLLSDVQATAFQENGADLSADGDWWLRTEDSGDIKFKYATVDGTIEETGDVHLRDKGVRPAIWVSLE